MKVPTYAPAEQVPSPSMKADIGPAIEPAQMPQRDDI